MDETKLNIMLAEAQLRARALQMAIRGHFSVFSSASEADEEALDALADDCVTNLDQLLHASAMVTVVLLAHGERKIEAIKEVRGHGPDGSEGTGRVRAHRLERAFHRCRR